ncbi:MAG TPA: type II toxin-antitoxin system VapC family toxin [Ilumatobacteraceae bacterium]|nr:type II toxin-antitoxin system VapC family toxin [Ilumatobacteraceae bacterium]
MIVVDASAIIDTLDRSAKAFALEPFLDDDLAAPDTLIPEVIRYYARMARAEARRALAESAVSDLDAADIHYVPIWPYTQRIWELRQSVSAYDACYVAVAEALQCPLLTTDTRLAGANDVRVPIIVV